MSLLKTNEIQNYNGSSLTLTASTVSTSAQLNTGGNISVTGSLNVSDDSTTRTNLGLGTIATQDSDSITVTGGTATLGALTVSGSDSGNLVRITQTGSGNALVVEDSTNPDSTPFVVDSSGNVGIGTSSPGVELEVDGDIRADGIYGQADTNTSIQFPGSDVITFNEGGSEAMRIDSSGNVGIGPSSLVSLWEGNLNIVQPSGTKTEIYFLRDTQVEAHIGFLGSNIDNNLYVGTGPALGDYGTYQLNQGNSWLSVSDERQKTNLIPIVDAINKIKQLRTVTGRFITDEDGVSRSFLIAQDFVNNFPEAVDTNNPEKYGLAYTDVIPLIVAGFKEQQTIIESQQSQIDALTTRIEELETT